MICAMIDDFYMEFHWNVLYPYRHLFFEDLADIRAEERARNNAKLQEVLERRYRQMEDLAEKKNPGK